MIERQQKRWDLIRCQIKWPADFRTDQTRLSGRIEDVNAIIIITGWKLSRSFCRGLRSAKDRLSPGAQTLILPSSIETGHRKAIPPLTQ